jgi:DNA-binding CsgD family transcriptional regulator
MAFQHARIAIASIGFGLLLVFNAFTLWSPSAPLFALVTDSASYTYLQTAAQIGFLGSFLLYGVAAFFVPQICRRIPFVETTGTLITGFVLLFMLFFTGSDSRPLLIISGVLIGISSTLSFMIFQRIFASSGLEVAKRKIIYGTMLSATVYFVLAFFSERVIAFLVSFAVVPLLILFLGFSLKGIEIEPVRIEPKARRFDKLYTVFARNHITLLCALYFAILGPFIGSSSLDVYTSPLMRITIAQMANLSAGIVLAILWFVLKRQVTVPTIFLATVPIAATALILLPFFESTYWPIFIFSIDLLAYLPGILMVVFCLEAARREKFNVLIMYSFFVGAPYVVRILGSMLGNFIGVLDATEQTKTLIASVILLYFIAILSSYVIWANRMISKSFGHPVPIEADHLKERCGQISQEKGLSPRESEIFELIARGRNVPTISKALSISENTVRTHTKSIYRALEVSSRQELIDLASS